jgi:hypothetical protein
MQTKRKRKVISNRGGRLVVFLFLVMLWVVASTPSAAHASFSGQGAGLSAPPVIFQARLPYNMDGVGNRDLTTEDGTPTDYTANEVNDGVPGPGYTTRNRNWPLAHFETCSVIQRIGSPMNPLPVNGPMQFRPDPFHNGIVS